MAYQSPKISSDVYLTEPETLMEQLDLEQSVIAICITSSTTQSATSTATQSKTATQTQSQTSPAEYY